MAETFLVCIHMFMGFEASQVRLPEVQLDPAFPDPKNPLKNPQCLLVESLVSSWLRQNIFHGETHGETHSGWSNAHPLVMSEPVTQQKGASCGASISQGDMGRYFKHGWKISELTGV